MSRRFMGSRTARVARMTALMGVVTLGVAACDDPDYATYCARKIDSVRAEDSSCQMAVGEDDPRSPFGWYYQQLPDGDDSTVVSVVSIGEPVRSGTYTRPGVGNLVRSMPSRPGTAGVPNTVTRGGLGVSSSGSSGS